MKYLFFSIPLIGLLFGCQSETKTKKKPLSPHQTAIAMVGDDYKETEDVLKFDLSVIPLNEVQEHLEYQVKKTSDDAGIISSAFGKKRISR